jgi:hypothetical protein
MDGYIPNPKEVLPVLMRCLQFRGMTLWVDGDQLMARHWSGTIPDDLVDLIQHFRDLLYSEFERACDARPARPAPTYHHQKERAA